MVNNTKRTVQVEAGQKLVLSTGTLVVEGQQSGFYAPYQGAAAAPPPFALT